MVIMPNKEPFIEACIHCDTLRRLIWSHGPRMFFVSTSRSSSRGETEGNREIELPQMSPSLRPTRPTSPAPFQLCKTLRMQNDNAQGFTTRREQAAKWDNLTFLVHLSSGRFNRNKRWQTRVRSDISKQNNPTSWDVYTQNSQSFIRPVAARLLVFRSFVFVVVCDAQRHTFVLRAAPKGFLLVFPDSGWSHSCVAAHSSSLSVGLGSRPFSKHSDCIETVFKASR